MIDKTRENGRTVEGGMGPWRARRSENNTSDRSDKRGAWRRACACKAHENPEIWGIGSGRGGTSLLCLFVVIKRGRSGDYTRVCTTFGLGLGLVKTESDTSKIHEGELCRGNLRPSNERL